VCCELSCKAKCMQTELLFRTYHRLVGQIALHRGCLSEILKHSYYTFPYRIPSLLDSMIRFDTSYQSTRPQGRMGETEAQGMKAERDFRSERADALFAKAAESLCSTRLALAQILSYLVMVFLQSFACTCLYSCTGLD